MAGVDTCAVTNEQALRRHFDATTARDWATAMDGYDEHVVLIPGRIDTTPRYGREAVGEFFGDWMRTFGGGVVFSDLRVEQGTDALAVSAHHRARGPSSGLEIDNDFFYAYWFRREKIIRVEMHPSMDDARAAAGVPG